MACTAIVYIMSDRDNLKAKSPFNQVVIMCTRFASDLMWIITYIVSLLPERNQFYLAKHLILREEKYCGLGQWNQILSTCHFSPGQKLYRIYFQNKMRSLWKEKKRGRSNEDFNKCHSFSYNCTQWCRTAAFHTFLKTYVLAKRHMLEEHRCAKRICKKRKEKKSTYVFHHDCALFLVTM